MTTHLSLQRMLLPTAQVSDLTTGSITLPGARGAFVPPLENGYSAIQTVTLTDSLSTEVTFNGLPSGANYFQLRIYAKDAQAGTSLSAVWARMRFNGDENQNYSHQYIITNGSSNSSNYSRNRASIAYWAANGDTTYPNAYAATVIDIYEPYSTTKNKSVMVWTSVNAISSGTSPIHNGFYASAWNSTSAITSITLLPLTGSYWKTGSTFALYGIK